jgi:hypothetical protein
MQISPIRSPLDMQRAQARLSVLGSPPRGSQEELEYAALWDAIEHYRCITDRPIQVRSQPDRPTDTPRQSGRDRSS